MTRVLLCAGSGLLVIQKEGLLFYRCPGHPDAPVPYAVAQYPVFLHSAKKKHGLISASPIPSHREDRNNDSRLNVPTCPLEVPDTPLLSGILASAVTPREVAVKAAVTKRRRP